VASGGRKLSVSLPGEDAEFLDAYADAHALGSRSAVVQPAIRALRRGELPDAYSQAWDEWGGGADPELWGAAAGNGL
jgi:Arc/MetJ-type ribon-helix-helix transcriptional regulator